MKIHELTFDKKDEIQAQFQVGALCAKVIAARQLSEDQIIDLFDGDGIKDPFCVHGMKEVVERIQTAKEKDEKILVCGDYDADGICATTILYDALRRYGVTCGFYIPNRFREGYGLHAHTVDMAKDKDYQLLITVDNGVKAQEALKQAQKHGVDVIVTDHHTLEEEVPCMMMLHPGNMGDDYQYLCGAGIALQISMALLGEIKEHVVLACVASIGDVMPLWKQTRQIVKKGMEYLRQGICEPIQLLSNEAYPRWDERMVAFQVVPKLNATGRLADLANANNTVRYLLMQDKTNMIAFVKQINDLNNKRRTMSTKMSEYARTLVDEQARFQILYQEDFHEGLVGLAAGKLSEELQQPVMVLAGHDDVLKGSIRTYGAVDLRDFFDGCKDLLLAYGGHRAAAGISIAKEHLEDIRTYAQTRMLDYPQEAYEESIDVIRCSMSELDVANVEELEHLAPFGEGFKKPVFYVDDYRVASIKELSNHKHVKWESLENIDALYFNAKEVYARYKDEKQLSFLGSLNINNFRNEKKVNIFVDEVIS